MDYSGFASRVVAEYHLFQMAITGRFSIVAASSDMTPKGVKQFQVDGYGLGRTFVSTVERTVDEYVTELLNGASEGLTKAVLERRDGLIKKFRKVVISNIETTASKLRLNALGVSGEIDAGVSGAISTIAQKYNQVIHFKTEDSASRSWESDHLIYTFARDFGYQTYIDSILATITEAGNDLAQVMYADAEHRNNGMVFSITGKSADYPSLEEIRKSVFHPNAIAMVKAYV
jgi:hypothetical protein